eukprot:3957193-Amphidinium_carterae.2
MSDCSIGFYFSALRRLFCRTALGLVTLVALIFIGTFPSNMPAHLWKFWTGQGGRAGHAHAPQASSNESLQDRHECSHIAAPHSQGKRTWRN